MGACCIRRSPSGSHRWLQLAADGFISSGCVQAMGDYVFTDATSGDEVRVEYTFGYKRNADGKVRIYLHHSSVPYQAAPAAPAVEEKEAELV